MDNMFKIKRAIFIFLISLNTLYSKDTIEIVGDVIQIAIPSEAFIATFYLDDTQGQYQFYKSFATNLGITYILKYSINETRPDNSNDRSFPSGHTSASFQGAAFIHKRYGLKYAIIPYLGASFVGYSRIVSKKHYLHDVIAGAVIGVASSFYFTTKYKDKIIKPIVYNMQNTTLYGINIIF